MKTTETEFLTKLTYEIIHNILFYSIHNRKQNMNVHCTPNGISQIVHFILCNETLSSIFESDTYMLNPRILIVHTKQNFHGNKG